MKVFELGGLKAMLVFIFLWSPALTCAQPSYSRKQIREFRLVKDFYKDLPDSATQVFYDVMGKIGGTSLHYTGRGDTLNADARLLMSTADLGSKVFVEVSYSVRQSQQVNSGSISFKVAK